jgi:hypothetical protein
MIQGQFQQKKKFERPPSQQIKAVGGGVHTCHPSFWGSINRRMEVQAGPGINITSYLKR